jgi:hypothetical protein
MSQSSCCHTVSWSRSQLLRRRGALRSRSRLLHRVGCRRRCRYAAWVLPSPSLHRHCAACGVAVAAVAPRGRRGCRRCAAWGVAVAVVAPRGCRGRGRCAAWSVAVGVVVPRGCRGRGRRAAVAPRGASRSRSLRRVGRHCHGCCDACSVRLGGEDGRASVGKGRWESAAQ